MARTAQGLVRSGEFMASKPKVISHIEVHPALPTQQKPADFSGAGASSKGVVRHSGPAIALPATQQKPAGFHEGEGVVVVHHHAGVHPPEHHHFGPEDGAAFHDHMAHHTGMSYSMGEED